MKSYNNLVLVTIIIVVACTSNDIKHTDAKNSLVENVLSFYREDSIASYYVESYNRGGGQQSWDEFVISNIDTLPLDGLGATTYLFKIPQFCSGCYNYYKVLGIAASSGEFEYFSLMDAYFYQQKQEMASWERNDTNLLQNGLNSVFSNHIVFENFSFDNTQDKEALVHFTDILCKDILGCSKISSEDDFQMLLAEQHISSDSVCINQMRQSKFRIEEALESDRYILYNYNGAVYEFAFEKEKGKSLHVNITLYPAACYVDWML